MQTLTITATVKNGSLSIDWKENNLTSCETLGILEFIKYEILKNAIVKNTCKPT